MFPLVLLSSIIIEPLVKVTFSVMSAPSVSLTNWSDHLTSYIVPAAALSGTVKASVRTTESSAATIPLPAPCPNAYLLFLYNTLEP